MKALCNLGPKSAVWLADIGITTRVQLARRRIPRGALAARADDAAPAAPVGRVLAGVRVVGAARARGFLAGRTSAQPRWDARAMSKCAAKSKPGAPL